MRATRRQFGTLAAGWSMGAPGAAVGWPKAWDRLLVEKAVIEGNRRFDPVENMVTRTRGAEYQYHTTVRAAVVHPTRDSLEHALHLLEVGGEENTGRARRTISRVIALQDTDPGSKWYGIWGWYLEEPPPRMSPADWNWADFNGSLLLMMEARHGTQLGEPLRAQVREAIAHAARSVRRRNVSMTYTNIAVKGTFVTLAAAQLLGDKDLEGYARDRLMRFCRTVDETGSFAEYNSPTYARVTITNLTRMRMVLKDPEVLARAERVHHRAWLHLASHWDAPRRQLAGPQSRCYSNDIGAAAWLEKALEGRLGLVQEANLPADGETGVHDYRCPADLQARFLEPGTPRQHREVFLPATEGKRPVQGTTWLDRNYSLGSVNRGDFWVQRRPLLAYWGAPPCRFVQVRVVKDDYDFASALLYAVQERGRVLGLVTFRSPGGDKHVSLDPIVDGEFMAARLRLSVEIQGDGTGTVRRDGGSFAVALGPAKLWIAFRELKFGSFATRTAVETEGGRTAIVADLLPAGGPHRVRWADLAQAFVSFTLAIDGGGGSIEEFSRACRGVEYKEAHEAGLARLAWGTLSLAGSDRVDTVDRQDRALDDRIGGAPVPLVRLSDERLAPDNKRGGTFG